MYQLRSRASDLLADDSAAHEDDPRSRDRRPGDGPAGPDQPGGAPRDGRQVAPPPTATPGRGASLPEGAGFGPAALAILLPGALGLAALALGILLPETSAPAPMLAIAVATALGLLTLFQGWRWHNRRRRAGNEAERLAQALMHDPDAVIISDGHGHRLAGNQAAGRLGVDAVLARLCAEPGRVIAGMIAETQQQGHAKRIFRGPAGALSVSVHCPKASALDGTEGTMFVWRLCAESMAPMQRPVDMLGLPVLTLGAEGTPARANEVLNALLQQGRKGAELALNELADELRVLASSRRADTVILPDRTTARFALPLPAADGQVDVLLLSAGQLPRADAAGMPEQPDFEDIPVALMHITPDGRVRRSNRQARALLGLPASRKAYFSELVEGLGRPVEDWLADAVAGRALNRPEVLRATLPSQETFVQVILRRAAPPDDTLVAVISDATELKSLEARFVQSQKMQAIGQLAGGVAHDFNNLLTAISGHCDLLLMNRDHYDPDYADLMQIHQNANRAAALVRQLLAFSRKQTLQPEWLALESLLEDLAHLLTRLVGERICLTLHHDSRLGMIRTDRRQLEQVILNLVVNARDAMPMGGEIRIETEALLLEEEVERGRARVPAGHYAVIRVIDEGIGIPADILDKIFEPFFTTKKLGEGTGLGLSTAYGIVKQMGGYIFADSTEGTGTVFTLYFATPDSAAKNEGDHEVAPVGKQTSDGTMPARRRPAVAEAGTAATLPARREEGEAPSDTSREGNAANPAKASTPPEDPRALVPQATARDHGAMTKEEPPSIEAVVLLVEDEAPVRAFAARALRLHGYQVIEAESGEQALEFLAEPSLKVDVFVSDVVMPGLDGPGWVNRARRDRPDVPVVFMSGHTQDHMHAALARSPGAAFLDKPFTLQTLCQTIDRQFQPGH